MTHEPLALPLVREEARRWTHAVPEVLRLATDLRGAGMRGYFGIGIYHGKTEHNIGTLWRSAHLYGAAFIFTVGPRYKRQASDTPHARLHTPMFEFDTVGELVRHLPYSCPLIAVELDPRAQMLTDYAHPERACYLLGAEDHGLPIHVLDRCHQVVQVETLRPQSMNVAVAGSLILHHRHTSRARVIA